MRVPTSRSDPRWAMPQFAGPRTAHPIPWAGYSPPLPIAGW